ncbi:hypothetical protein Lesp02_40070 [Lentzea sp. NBRC 105346]|uniref:hypothetical protein n=1 Tax=Lentzea sp. NBRC 105346 TaxID=3032205 RepID=UPI0024A13EF6|nr:hypothetical protein [Lentzea sp. NBRC 105346]GLZ31819.1 hypothetical protein Lesp02_40070 [Lentzea sp. NBRC 105346]
MTFPLVRRAGVALTPADVRSEEATARLDRVETNGDESAEHRRVRRALIAVERGPRLGVLDNTVSPR